MKTKHYIYYLFLCLFYLYWEISETTRHIYHRWIKNRLLFTPIILQALELIEVNMLETTGDKPVYK